MAKRPLYNTGFPIFTLAIYLLPIVCVIIFIAKGLSIPASLFYGSILIVVAVLLFKNNQWIRLYEDKLVLVNLNLSFKRIEIPLEVIESVATEEGIDPMIIGDNFIAGVPDRLIVNYKIDGKEKSVLLRTIGLDSENPLYEILVNKLPGRNQGNVSQQIKDS